ncbi:MAG: SPFH domain-containing protein [Chloroflexi bacterium]|nr:SPFH domain-containing protein [Chloroflexota bacterium]
MRIIDVIDHANVAADELVWREPQGGSGDWRMGSQVIVSDSQAAIFVRDGQVLDMLGPGRHTLSTANLPILSGLIGLATSGRTPFPAELYYVNLRDMPQVGWGTNPPIVLETPGKGLGVVLLITHGVVDIGVDDAMLFLKQYGIRRPSLYLSDIKDRIQSMLLGEIAQLVGKSGAQSVPDANKVLSELEGAMLVQLNDKFKSLGMRIKAFESNPFTVKNVTIDELRDYVSLDVWERARMTSARATAMEDAAKNPGMGGTLAGAGVGFGVGQQLGNAMAGGNPQMEAMQRQMEQQQMMMNQMIQQMMNQNIQQQSQPQQAAAPNPQTKEEVQALLDNLDMKLANGEISEQIYTRLHDKWAQRLKELGG